MVVTPFIMIIIMIIIMTLPWFSHDFAITLPWLYHDSCTQTWLSLPLPAGGSQQAAHIAIVIGWLPPGASAIVIVINPVTGTQKAAQIVIAINPVTGNQQAAFTQQMTSIATAIITATIKITSQATSTSFTGLLYNKH